MRRSLICLLIAFSVVTVDAQRGRARRVRPVPPLGVSLCGANCVLETTFNCPAVSFVADGSSNAIVCPAEDAVKGNNTNAPGGELMLAANYPNGRGGLGFRHYRCDGVNCGGGGLGICWPGCSGEVERTELWMRFYMRYQSGFAWLGGVPSYTKDWYINSGSAHGNATTFGFHGAGWGFAMNSGSPQNVQDVPTWSTVMGGTTGDGNWHCYEMHMKLQSSLGVPDGVFEAWVDGSPGVSNTSIDNSSTGGWSFAQIGGNQSNVSNGGATVYTDFDDIAISAVGRIGCH